MSTDPRTVARDIRCKSCGCEAGHHRVHSHRCANAPTRRRAFFGGSCGCTGFDPEPRPHVHPCTICYGDEACSDLRCAIELPDEEGALPWAHHDVCRACVAEAIRLGIDEHEPEDLEHVRRLIGDPLTTRRIDEDH